MSKVLTVRMALLGVLCLVVGIGAGFVFAKRGMPLVGESGIRAIGIFTSRAPDEPFTAGDFDNPVLTADDIHDVDAVKVADPFMVKEKDTWYMFFEVLERPTDKGLIALATSPNARKWTYDKVVIKEPFHLSYPYVFKHEGQYYMVPDSFDARAVWLYKADRFPDKWSKVTKLLDGHPFVDSSLVYRDGRWWMFSSSVGNDILLLYHADKLTGPWHKHPQNPLIFADANIARPGGRVVQFDGRLLRYTQDDDPMYGLLVRAFEILELTPTTYREKPVDQNPIIAPSGSGWNAVGMHHIDPHQIGPNKWIACVDGLTKIRVYGWEY